METPSNEDASRSIDAQIPSASAPPIETEESDNAISHNIDEVINQNRETSRRHGQASSSSSSNNSVNEQQPNNSPQSNQFFQCNICFEEVTQPVVTMCGHLYCWPCIYRWFEQSLSCPVCKADSSSDKLIPIYGRHADRNITEDPRNTIPERPAAPRPQTSTNQNPFFQSFPQFFGNWPYRGANGMLHANGGFMMWGGLGGPMTIQTERQFAVSQVFMVIGFILLIIILFL